MEQGEIILYKLDKLVKLEVRISVGYTVKSVRSTQFRKFANKLLKDLEKKLFAFSKMKTPASLILNQL